MSNIKPKTKKDFAAKRVRHREKRQIAGLNRAPVSLDKLALGSSFGKPDFVKRGSTVDGPCVGGDCCL